MISTSNRFGRRHARMAASVAALAAGLLGAAGLSPASAATTSPTASATAQAGSVITYPGQSAAGTVSALATAPCTTPITVYGYTGRRVCGFDYSAYSRGGSNLEWFVVGGDYAIWHIWPGSGGWRSLGGVARSAAPNGAYATRSPVGVKTRGTDNAWWCRSWPYGASQGWYKGAACNNAS